MAWWSWSAVFVLLGIAALLLGVLLPDKSTQNSLRTKPRTAEEQRRLDERRPDRTEVFYSAPTGHMFIQQRITEHHAKVQTTLAELATAAQARITDQTAAVVAAPGSVDPSPLISAVVYINMAKNPERDTATRTALKGLNITTATKVLRFEGIAVPDNGAKGCFLSHIHSLSWAAQMQSGSHVLIMEDDVEWYVDSWDELLAYVTEADAITNGRWDVMVFGQYVHDWQQLHGTERVFRLFKSTTTSAYLVNAAYVQELAFKWQQALEPLMNVPKFLPEHNLDQIQGDFQKVDIWLGFHKALAGQRPGQSIIGDGVWADNRWTCSDDFQTWQANGTSQPLTLRPRAGPTRQVAVCLVATGRYKQFLPNVMQSCVQHMCKPHRLEFHVITDAPSEVADAIGPCRIFKYFTPRKGFPGDTLYRYHYMLKAQEALKKVDHVFYMDADYWVCNPTDTEQLLVEGLVATSHILNLTERSSASSDTHGPVETNLQSTAGFPPGTGNKRYYCGGFQGGSAVAYLQACLAISAQIDQDDAHQIMAKWHDESHWNRYLWDHPPAVVLSQSYMFPEQCLYDTSQFGGQLKRWDITPIMVAMDKSHKDVRAQ